MDAADRARQVQLAVSFIDAGLSVNFTGLRGSGRSTAMAAVIRELEDRGRRVVRLTGIRALGDGRFTALALAGIDAPPGRSAATTVADLTTELASLLTVPGTVIAIDDADDLDPATMGVVVAALVRSGSTRLISTRPSGLRQVGVSALTATLTTGVRIDLAPLNHLDIHALVLELLGGPVGSETLSAISIESGGLPGLISAIVRVGAVSGRITRRRGLWDMTGDLWHPLIAQALEPLLIDLGEEDMRGLESLAWAGVVSLERALNLVGPDTLSTIADLGLTQMLHLGGDSFVAVYPPLLAEHIRRGAQPLRQAIAAGRTDILTGRLTPHSDRLIGSDHLFNQRYREHWRSEMVARTAVWEHSPSPASAMPLVVALYQLGDQGDRVKALLRDTPGGNGTAADRTELMAARAMNLAVIDDDLDAALAALQTDDPTLVTEYGYLRAAAAHLSFVAGRRSDPEAFVPAPHDSERSRHGLAIVRAELLLADGCTADAREAIEERPVDDPSFRDNLELVRGLLYVFEARFDDAIAYSRPLLESARQRLDGSAVETHSYVIAVALTLGGRTAELAEHLESIVSLAQPPTTERYLRQGSLVIAALDLLRRGLAQQARSIAEQTVYLGSSTGPFPGMGRPYGLWALLNADDPELAAEFRDQLWEAFEEKAAQGSLVHGVISAVWLLERWPDPVRNARIAELTGTSQSALLRALGEYLEVISRGDPSEILEFAEELSERGLGFHAIRSRLTAAMIRRRDGDPRGSFEIARDAWETMRRTSIGSPPLFAPLAGQVDLTSREWQIAKLIQQGASNARIADELVLSVRTVENHLSNVFRKVGCEGREELAAALDTWLVESESVEGAL